MYFVFYFMPVDTHWPFKHKQHYLSEQSSGQWFYGQIVHTHLCCVLHYGKAQFKHV